ncbi:Putative uncharacterized protein [Halomonas sp. R57-5]|uniref:hypothetical protein n=1 Tax=Halomonas sp. R57-5 TaxID=1610576 RepID=UPI0005FC3CE9|nr:hypothetical protein [Halomonas sp. R57-5]CEP36895.1 Putative uncharacterized protein [Halomonas sp. R57-5]
MYLRNGIVDLRLLLIFLTVLLMPSFIFVTLDTSSLAIGMLVSSFLIQAVLTTSRGAFKIDAELLFLFSIILLLVAINCAVICFIYQDIKPLLSLIWFYVAFTAMLLGRYVFYMSFDRLYATLFYSIVLLLIIGWVEILFGMHWGGYGTLEKSVFPFSEESHYALALCMMILPYVLISNSFKVVVIFLLNVLFLALLFPNLTLLVVFCLSCLMYVLRMKPVYLFFCAGFLIIIGLVFFIFLLDYFPYFQSRLTFENSDNLTTLVFLQGWIMAYTNLVETYGLGIGFQMLGTEATYFPDVSERIYYLTGKYFNIYDGGFLLAKIVAEFGILGLLLVLFYLFSLLKISFYINRYFRSAKENAPHEAQLKKKILVYGFFIAFSIEFFLRGYGYFSPGVFLVIAAIYVSFLNKRRIME